MSRVIYESEKRITCGWQGYSGHKGVDLGYRANEEYNKVYANCKGTVVEVQDGLGNSKGATGAKSWGNYVLIKHANGYHTRYAHLRSGIKVKTGQEVDENTVIGIIGDSGNANGRHLHFEVSQNYSSSTRIDPTPYLTKAVYESLKPIPKPTNEFKIGDRVVVSGYATSSSDGSGSHTANYGGNANDPSDIRYVTKITSLDAKRPYHISSGKSFGDGNKGWVSKSQIKKI